MIVDWETGIIDRDGERFSIKTPEAFDIISEAYLKIGWQNKHVYSFTWMGRPVIQLPEDLIRVQELIYDIKPDFIIETGIAHGGSLIFYASLLRAMGKGKVVGVDIDIREHNRKEIEKSEVSDLITMFQGSSVDVDIIESIADKISSSGIKDPVIMVLLDSCHTKEHTLRELNVYCGFLNVGSYIIACDGGIMELVSGMPGAIKADTDWGTNNPKAAAKEFVEKNKDFVLIDPEFRFNEGSVSTWNSYWGGGIIKRVS